MLCDIYKFSICNMHSHPHTHTHTHFKTQRRLQSERNKYVHQAFLTWVVFIFKMREQNEQKATWSIRSDTHPGQNVKCEQRNLQILLASKCSSQLWWSEPLKMKPQTLSIKEKSLSCAPCNWLTQYKSVKDLLGTLITRTLPNISSYYW